MSQSQKVNFGLWYFVLGAMLRMGKSFSDSLKLASHLPGLEKFTAQVAHSVDNEGQALATAISKAARDHGFNMPNLVIQLTKSGVEMGMLDNICLSAALMIYSGDKKRLFSDFYELTGLDEDWQLSLHAFGSSIMNEDTFRASLQEASEHHLSSTVWEDITDAVVNEQKSFCEAIKQCASITPLAHPIIYALLMAGDASGTLDEITLFLTPTYEADEVEDSYRGVDRTWIIDLELLRIYLNSGYELCIALTNVAERSIHKPAWTAIKDGFVQANGQHFLSEVIKEHAPNTPLANADFLRSLQEGEQFGRLQDGIREFFPEDVVGRIISKGLPPELYLFYVLQDSGVSVLQSLHIMNHNTDALASVIDEVKGGVSVAEAIEPEGRCAKRDTYLKSYLNNDTIFRFFKAGQDTYDLTSVLRTLSLTYAL